MPTTFNLEQEALASYNYLERLVEPDTGFTYFNVFLTNPAEAVHDWPDFLDVPGRSAETCVLLRHMTGRSVATEGAFFHRILSLQEDDGLFRRPETAITRHEFRLEEQALVMGALVARAVADGDEDARARLQHLVTGLQALEPAPGPMPAMLIRPLVRAGERLEIEGALRLARQYRTQILQTHPLFRPDGGFAGHVHSQLYAAAGLVELGRLTGDDALIEHMDRVYRFMRAQSTRFGFVPELSERRDDVVGCETCCLMDFLHLALALTRAGRTDYFDDIERAVRNHLVESRVRSGDWLPAREHADDEGLIRRAGLRQAVPGAYAGWSGPNHILAYDEHLPPAWIKGPELAPLYLDKVRALQNCCSPSGPKALHLAWQQAARVEGNTLRVNLLMDRALPEAEVRSWEPWEGRVEVTLRAPLRVALRRPGFVPAGAMRATVGERPLELREEDGYVVAGEPAPGDTLVFRYPLPEREETLLIGNAGFQQYGYTVHWRGATVMGVEPGDNPATGRSHLMAKPVRLYYGTQGPHPLYQRRGLLASAPEPDPLHPNAGPDVW